MLKLDNNLLQELGLGVLPDDQKKAMLQHIYETLELRVGTQLANQMTDQQLEEFEQFIDEGGEGNQAQALQWLETNLPNYKQVVNEVFEMLKTEVKQMAPQIVATSGVDAGAQAQQPALQANQPYQAPAQTDAQPYQPPARPSVPQPPEYQQPVQQAQPVQQYAQPTQPTPQPYQYPSQQPPAGPGPQTT